MRTKGLRRIEKKAKAFWSIARFAIPYTYKADRQASVFFTTSAIAGALVGPLLALAIGVIVERLQDTLRTPADRLQSLDRWLVVAGVAGVLGVLAGAVRKYCRHRLIDEVNLRVNKDVLECVSRLDLAQLESQEFQALFVRANQNPHGNLINASLGALETSSLALQSVGLVAVLFGIEPVWSACLLFVGVPHLIHRWALSTEQHAARHAEGLALRWAAYYANVLVNVAFAPAVKVMGLSPVFLGRYSDLSRQVIRISSRHHFRRAVATVLSATVSIVVMLLMIASLGRRVLAGDIGVGAFVSYWAAAWRLRSVLSDLGESLSVVFDSSCVVGELRTLLASEPAMRSGAARPAGRVGRIELRRAGFRYPGSDRAALRDITLTIEPGETIAIVGSNGAGKSTLAKLICRLYDVTEGAVLVDGNDVRECDLDDLRERIAYVHQHAVRLEATASDNIAFGDWKRLLDDADGVRSMAVRCGVDELIARLPKQYETMLGRNFGDFELSGGQWQRLCIARAMARADTSIVVMDEPAASLDQENEDRLYVTIRDQLRDKTAILVTHQLSTIRTADRIVFLRDGTIAELGTHAELMALGGGYAKMVEAQLRRMTSETNRRAA